MIAEIIIEIDPYWVHKKWNIFSLENADEIDIKIENQYGEDFYGIEKFT